MPRIGSADSRARTRSKSRAPAKTSINTGSVTASSSMCADFRAMNSANVPRSLRNS